MFVSARFTQVCDHIDEISTFDARDACRCGERHHLFAVDGPLQPDGPRTEWQDHGGHEVLQMVYVPVHGNDIDVGERFMQFLEKEVPALARNPRNEDAEYS